MPLPPLDELRAFEAAFRHRSMTRAGEALNLTHGAVSRQIASLERDLGVALFRRVARGLEPTPAGTIFHGAVRRALREIDEAAATLREEARGRAVGVVRVATTPSFAARWLLPRLGEFRLNHPEIEVQLEADMRLVDLQSEGFNLAIRYGSGQWPGVSARLLLREELFPVCAPGLIAPGTSATVALRNFTLLHDGHRPRWNRWLSEAGLSVEFATSGMVFNDYNLLIEAAINGHGIGLGRGVLVASELKSGKLVAPFGLSVPSEWAYHLVWHGNLSRSASKAFADWLVARTTNDEIAVREAC